MFEVTREATLEAKQGFRAARIYGWQWLHLTASETAESKQWGVATMIGRFHFSVYFTVIA